MSFVVQVLYYLGVMQWVISKLGFALQKIMGTTVCESMNASANIFLGMVIYNFVLFMNYFYF